MAIKIRYNSPVVLTFSLLSIAIFVIDYFFANTGEIGPITRKFCVLDAQFNWQDPLSYLKIFTYTIGHVDRAHIMGNMSIFLLIAPIMEEKYGSRAILVMMMVTAFITAVFQIILFNSNLLGASGLVFMFIILVSFADVKKGTIPLTFILVAFFYIGTEIVHSLQANRVSEYAHIAGGLMGGLFGMLYGDKKISPPA